MVATLSVRIQTAESSLLAWVELGEFPFLMRCRASVLTIDLAGKCFSKL